MISRPIHILVTEVGFRKFLPLKKLMYYVLSIVKTIAKMVGIARFNDIMACSTTVSIELTSMEEAKVPPNYRSNPPKVLILVEES